jgi:uncharacterized protein YraI
MRKTVLFLLVLALAVLTVGAQDIVPNPDTVIDPSANVSWPPPVYTLRGNVDVRGSASLPNMTNYFLQFRPLVLGETTEQDELDWLPVTLPSTNPVSEDVLGTWNTETTEDGLYEMRLAVNVAGQAPTYFVVSPLRIENNPPDFVIVESVEATVQPIATLPVMVTATSAPITRPTLAPSPTAFDTTPRVTARLNANVRAGDSTGYDIVASLQSGQTADVIGISSSGSGWFYIRLSDGRTGWIAPSVVDLSGNIGQAQLVAPPATPTPRPTATFTPPPVTVNFAGSPPDVSPDNPTCDVQFEVLINLVNNGSGRSTPVSVLFQNIRAATGEVQQSFTRVLPELNPGQGFVVGGSFTISTFYNEQHIVRVTVDSGNAVPELNENDNVLQTTYTLQKGSCP